ncbi:TRAP transporter small permease [Oceanispirochaeta sp.]|jgi:TRAP-type C4-dicarboxylate transport system permease small subunit|uniref:TRAP transporter small permease n=1 Tax=Oceanispirochaeta sp. TaxID=2035350 RepID=UPI002613D89C|nr:TRAP transporter small permease [Oceanispirochaeta sp.]MDA3955588.1 TRAP transporter small permease [Oceanispirochaeta sp.]
MPGEVKKSRIQWVEDQLVRIIGGIIGLLLALMVIIVFSNVVARYFLNSSLAWSEELSRFMLIWLAFLGAVLAYVKNEHLGLDILIIVLPYKISRMLLVLSNLLVIVGIGILLHGGWTMTAFTFNSGWTSPALAIPYGIVYFIVPFSGVLLLMQAFLKLGDNISNLNKALKGDK